MSSAVLISPSVERVTGFAIGGVPPVEHVRLTYDELVRIIRGTESDLA